jgi:hypothetical protein
MTGHAPIATQFAGWGPKLPPEAQGEQNAIANGDQPPIPTQVVQGAPE